MPTVVTINADGALCNFQEVLHRSLATALRNRGVGFPGQRMAPNS